MKDLAGSDVRATISHVDADGKVSTTSIPFDLEPGLPAGELPERVIDELMHARNVAKDYAQGYGEAVKAQAEKHQIPVGALKRYIAARCDDKLAEADAETSALAKLLDS